MTYALLADTWVAHSSRFTLEILGPQLIAYTDPVSRTTLAVDATGDVTVLDVSSARTRTDEGAEPTPVEVLATRCAMGLNALGVPRVPADGQREDLLGVALTLDLEGLQPADIVALADLRDGEVWSGDVCRVDIADGDALVTIPGPDVDIVTWRVPQGELVGAVYAVAVDLAGGMPWATGVNLSESPADLEGVETTAVVTDAAGNITRISLTPQASYARVTGPATTLTIEMIRETSAMFLLKSLEVSVADGQLSHQIEVTSADGTVSSSSGVKTMADLLDWYASATGLAAA